MVYIHHYRESDLGKAESDATIMSRYTMVEFDKRSSYDCQEVLMAKTVRRETKSKKKEPDGKTGDANLLTAREGTHLELVPRKKGKLK
jgi:hypothetical protein